MSPLSLDSPGDSGRHDLQCHHFAHHHRPGWMPQKHISTYTGWLQPSLPHPYYPHSSFPREFLWLLRQNLGISLDSHFLPWLLIHSNSQSDGSALQTLYTRIRPLLRTHPATILVQTHPHFIPPNAFLSFYSCPNILSIKYQPEQSLYNVGQTRALLAPIHRVMVKSSELPKRPWQSAPSFRASDHIPYPFLLDFILLWISCCISNKPRASPLRAFALAILRSDSP